MIKNVRDLLALILAAGVMPALWALHGAGVIALPEAALGASVALETLIIQFYFRKKSSGETPG